VYFWGCNNDFFEKDTTSDEITPKSSLSGSDWDYPVKQGMEKSKYFEKFNNENFASAPEMFFSLRIMVSILDVEKYPEFMASPNRESIAGFIKSGWFSDKDLPISEIGRMIDNYINNKN